MPSDIHSLILGELKYHGGYVSIRTLVLNIAAGLQIPMDEAEDEIRFAVATDRGLGIIRYQNLIGNFLDELVYIKDPKDAT